MNNPYKEIAQEKLFALQSYYRELAELQHITFGEYCGNHLYRRAVERLLQLIVSLNFCLEMAITYKEAIRPGTHERGVCDERRQCRGN